MLNEIEAWNSGLVLMQLQVDLSVRGVYQEFNSCPIKTLKLMNRKQNVVIAFGFKSYTAVSTLPARNFNTRNGHIFCWVSKRSCDKQLATCSNELLNFDCLIMI